MGLSLPHLIVLALVVLLLFGRGRISEMMGDFGKGIKSFKDGVADETTNRSVTPPAQLTAQTITQSPAPQAYAPPVATPHPEVVPHGVAPLSSGSPNDGQPKLNGEPLGEYAADPRSTR